MTGPLCAVLVALFQAPVTPGEARAVIDRALASVENGAGEADLAGLARAAGSPLERLELGALRVLLYRDSAAEKDLTALAAGTGAVAVWASFELAASYQRRGFAVDARRMFDRTAGLAAAASDSVATVMAELALAAFDIRAGATEAAAGRIARAASLIPPGTPVLEARAACQRAALLNFTGQPGGDHEAERGAVLAEAAGDRRLAGQCLLTVGAALIQRGEINAGATSLDRAEPLLRAARDAATLAAVLQWRGYAMRILLRLGDAHATLLEALTLAERSGAASALAWTRLNLASIAGALGDLEGARDHLALAAAEFDAQDDQWGRHSSLTLLSAMLRRLGALDSAERVAEEVEAWGRRVPAPGSVAGALTERLAMAGIRGDWSAAGERIDSLDALYGRLGWAVWREALVGERAAVALATDDLAEAERLLRRQLGGYRDNQPLLRYGARVRLAEVAVRSGRLTEGAGELRSASDELDAARRSLPPGHWRQLVLQASTTSDPDLRVAWLLASLAPVLPEEAFNLAERRRAGELRNRLIRASTLLPGQDTSRPAAVAPGTLRRFQGSLREAEAAALVYVTGRGDEPTTLFVVSADSLFSVMLPSADSLAPGIARTVALLESGGTGEGNLRELHRVLVAPALRILGALPRRLVIVPEGPLYRVPFGALLDGQDAPLVSRTVVAVVPAAAVFTDLRERAATGATRGILALADPPPHAAEPGAVGLATLFAARGAAGPLPGARGEARRAIRFAPDSDALIGRRATESAMQAAGPGRYRVLHFASHALTDGDSPLRAAIALAPDSAGDGFLTAAELGALRLSADLVVLSACRSAGGTVLLGEGLQGLAWPLLSAGARSVVASLWDVNDRATAGVMADFYDAMVSGLPVADALASAQRTASARGDPPAVWAAFTVIGDPLASPVLRAPRPRWPVPAAIVVLVFGSWWLISRSRRRGRAQG